MSFKGIILYVLFLIIVMLKTIVLVCLVKEYCVEWGFVVGQLDAMTTASISSYVVRKAILCTVK